MTGLKIIAAVFLLVGAAYFASGAVAVAGGLPSSSQQTAFPGQPTAEPPTSPPSAGMTASQAGAASPDDSYQLGASDKLRITIYGEPDLSGEFMVDGTGLIQLPLIGQVHAAGLTVHQFQDEIANQLRAGYLKDPRVSVEVENYRPFYIFGEVNRPGQYAYVTGLNVINAVALAGGYTYRANDTDAYIRRNGGSTEVRVPADATTKVMPGDSIRIAERIF
ncbi:MAG: polysaccharide biosynthesis/export family protein [Candidatus Sulfotelmatobacter sp.]